MATSLVQRFAIGRPHDEATSRATTALIGRALLATIFILSGVRKLTDWSTFVGILEGQDLPMAPVLLGIAAALEILGGISLFTGTFTRLGALALMAFIIPTTLIMHDFWALEGAARQQQMAHFLKNLSIFGGLLLVLDHGAGRMSVDDKIARRLEHD
jgi:putative oxidoreductase